MKKRRVLIIALMILVWIGELVVLNLIDGFIESLSTIVKTVDINLLGIATTRTTVSLETIGTIATWAIRAVWVSVIGIAILAWCPSKKR